MKIKSIIKSVLLVTAGLTMLTGCQKGDLVDNPNVAGGNAALPVPLLLNHLTSSFIKSSELPFGDASKYNQYIVANYAYYRGTNNYATGFTNTIDSYDIMKYAIAMQTQASKAVGTKVNAYYAIGQFFTAYAGVWLTQRVGDIPFSSVNGSTANLTPKYDSQHDVYKRALALLDSANNTINSLYTSSSPTTKITPTGTFNASSAPLNPNPAGSTGDIFALTYQQWQKVINTYRLRVLISLSKRATDNADLNIPQQFTAIIGNPTQYPIMTGNTDNLVYKFIAATNPYSTFSLGFNNYNNFANVSSTYLNIAKSLKDPRAYVVATPAPDQVVKQGVALNDFNSFVGADVNLGQSALLANSNAYLYSFSNYNRYYVDKAGASAEPFVFIGYPEMCFNIAEAINRGWITGSSSTWYNNGVNASLALYGITEGKVLTVNYPVAFTSPFVASATKQGDVWGTVTVNLAQFQTNIAYAGDNATGLNQILTQKYLALNNNSGWEAYYNYRRTGVPAFAQGGAGIGTPTSAIPRRFLYPQGEVTYNADHYKAALASQGFSSDDITKDTWLTK